MKYLTAAIIPYFIVFILADNLKPIDYEFQADFFGITTGTQGFLFDSSFESKKKLSIPQTNITKFLKSDHSIKYYKSLDIEDRCRVMDILYEPNGYTIIGFTKQAFEKLSNERLKKNFIKIK